MPQPVSYSTALDRWLEEQQQAQSQWQQAADTISELVNLFQPGGGYGRGQLATIERQGRRARASALADQVATGMSSGSLATATGLRVNRDVTQAALGVQDQRTQFLSRALETMANLQSQYGQYLGGAATTYADLVNQEQNRVTHRQTTAANTRLANQQTQAQVDLANRQQDLAETQYWHQYYANRWQQNYGQQPQGPGQQGGYNTFQY